MKHRTDSPPVSAQDAQASLWRQASGLCLRLFTPLLIVAVITLLLAAPQPAQANTPPTVNGLFYGNGDYLRYPATPYAISDFGSKLYVTLIDDTLYVALVVDRSFNDMVFDGDQGSDYLESAGWNVAGGNTDACRRIDSEYAEFSLTVGDDTWEWRQGLADQGVTGGNPCHRYNKTQDNWVSHIQEGTPPPGYTASSSFVWNMNNYAQRLAAGTNTWTMPGADGDATTWKSPWVGALPGNPPNPPENPDSVIDANEGYPPTGQITWSPTYEWEWSMVYEWSVDLSGYDEVPAFVVAGLSHHSPSKIGDENDVFSEYPSDPLMDFGDLPDSYRTLLANDGARHILDPNGPRLGQRIDSEPDGQPHPLALGDDLTGVDDEDGITINLAAETITAFVTNGPAVLGAWFDWNNDGDFDDAGEFFFWDVDEGENILDITVPSAFMQDHDELFARFRIFSSAAAAPSGGAELIQNDYYGLGEDGEVEDYHISPSASIGNRVWLDENSDGYQDAGEPGIPNVQVELYDAQGNLVATTYTDSNGYYLFNNLWPGTYYVRVLDGSDDPNDYTLPFPGMLQTPPSLLPGADFGNQDGSTGIPNTALTGYPVTVNEGEENPTADFGYNYRPAGEVNNPGPGATGAIGDRIWSDANGDGAQDPGEPGLAGVAVTLYYDSNGDGVYDAVYATTTTDAAGNYIFNDLPPGAYVVRVDDSNFEPGGALEGYTQTGDPDDFGQLAGDPDNQTTTPIILAPGDVFLNADFGYQPPAGQNNSIGDLIFLDASGDGSWDAGEPGIPGVTVALLDENDNIIATTITDMNGEYLFTGLRDGTYTVWVNDTANILDSLRQSSLPDNDNDGGQPCGVCNNRNTVTISGDDNLFQDFGYLPAGHSAGDGLIGDRVWLDINSDGVQDPNEPGLEGIRVLLRDSDLQIVGVAYTDRNGFYAFGGLPAGDYTVSVLPPADMNQTFDADGLITPHQSAVTIGNGEPLINLDQDFGYRGTGSIGDLVWGDLNADGEWQDGDEPGIGGVTLELYWDLDGAGEVNAGDPLVGRAVTAADGSYLFEGLPTDDGSGSAHFVVVVTDEAKVLNGYWHSLGTPGANNHSQTDPYPLTLTPGDPDNLTADFGYYVQPAALGNRVWLDVNQDGIQDPDELGIPDIPVTLTIIYANGDTVTVVTRTDANGFYSFGNLLLDEDHASSAEDTATPSQPLYTISVATPPNATPTLIDQGTGMNDSNDHSGVNALATQGQTDVTINAANPDAESAPNAGYDFGFYGLTDFDDLPESYSTLLEDNGPYHINSGLPGSLRLGTEITLEEDGSPSPNADGDDGDDGVVRHPDDVWLPDETVRLIITVSGGDGAVGGWFDWNNSDQFDDANNFVDFGILMEGTHTVNVVIPDSYTPGRDIYARFRVFDPDNIPGDELTASDYQGGAVGGEVEGYLWKFSPTAITLQSILATPSQQQAALPAVILALMVLLLTTGYVIRRRELTSP